MPQASTVIAPGDFDRDMHDIRLSKGLTDAAVGDYCALKENAHA